MHHQNSKICLTVSHRCFVILPITSERSPETQTHTHTHAQFRLAHAASPKNATALDDSAFLHGLDQRCWCWLIGLFVGISRTESHRRARAGQTCHGQPSPIAVGVWLSAAGLPAWLHSRRRSRARAPADSASQIADLTARTGSRWRAAMGQ